MRVPHDLPGEPAGAVYGTIVVAGQLAIEASSSHSAGQMLGTLAATLVVFWLVHAYTDALGGVIGSARTTSLRHALRAEWPIVESGLLPAAVLAAVVAGGAGARTAASAALVVSAVELVGWAYLAARRAGARGWRRAAFVAVAAVLGAGLVALKYLLH